MFLVPEGSRVYLPLYAVRYFSGCTLNVQLRHGLANRLITLASCLAASSSLGKEFKFIWNVNEFCGCAFDDLFDCNVALQAKDCFVDYNDDATFTPLFLSPCKSQFFDAFRFHHFRKGGLNDWAIHNTPFLTGKVDPSALLFNRALCYLQPSQDVLSLLRPLHPDSVGVHIRRGDSPWQRNSPVESFQHVMDQYLNSNPKVHFFLATDSSDVRASMISRYGNRLHSLPSLNSRSCKSGLQSALADLLSLSMTSCILGTYNSSFSWLASAWGLIDLVIVKDSSS